MFGSGGGAALVGVVENERLEDMSSPAIPSPFQFVLLTLATYRLAMLIAVEKGPARLLARLRRLPPPKSSAREGLSCPFCVGMYVATFMAVGWCWLQREWLSWPLLWLALAGASSWMIRLGRYNE